MGWSKPWPVKTQVGKKKTFVLKSDDNFNAAIINHGIKEILLIGGASMAQKKKNLLPWDISNKHSVSLIIFIHQGIFPTSI